MRVYQNLSRLSLIAMAVGFFSVATCLAAEEKTQVGPTKVKCAPISGNVQSGKLTSAEAAAAAKSQADAAKK